MGHLRDEERTAMSVLLEQGHTQSAVARLLGVSEGTVRYHRKRMKGAALDGRRTQVPKAAAFSAAIEAWRSQQARCTHTQPIINALCVPGDPVFRNDPHRIMVTAIDAVRRKTFGVASKRPSP